MSQMNPDEKYEFYVYNYSSNGAKNSDALGKSEAVVKLYLSNGEMMQYSVPSGTGTVWNVFNIVNGEVIMRQNQVTVVMHLIVCKIKFTNFFGL